MTEAQRELDAKHARGYARLWLNVRSAIMLKDAVLLFESARASGSEEAIRLTETVTASLKALNDYASQKETP